MRILALEPYFGGSHRAFLEGLAAHLPHEIELLTLPAHHWKWRMRLAAPFFAKAMEGMEQFELLLCSSMLDVAALRGLAPAWVRKVPVLTYFHENQFAYPVRQPDERDLHFGLTNLTTALASDRLAFNSAHNLRTFLQGCCALPKQGCDMTLAGLEDSLRAKAALLPPGLDFSEIDAVPRPRKEGPPVLVWNHRWEHDKNPELFFETLFQLEQKRLDFRLVLLGQAFAERPAIFEQARQRLAHRSLHFGYATDRQDYIFWLKQGDLVVSTAEHEFFGMAVLEAVRAGCRPLLPQRLSYPELFPASCLYREGELLSRLEDALRQPRPLPPPEARQLTDKFSWAMLADRYVEWFDLP